MRHRSRRLLLLVLPLLLSWAAHARAELVVVADARAGIGPLSREQVINIFLGRYRKLPSGQPAQPIDQPADKPARATFYRLLVHKELADINAYWARLVFSGKTQPPVQASSSEQLVELVLNTPGAIGYLDRQALDPRLTVVMELSPLTP